MGFGFVSRKMISSEIFLKRNMINIENWIDIQLSRPFSEKLGSLTGKDESWEEKDPVPSRMDENPKPSKRRTIR